MDGYKNILMLIPGEFDTDMMEVMESNKLAVMERIVDCVDIGYNMDLDYVPVLYIEKADFEMGIEPKDFNEQLDITEEYFVSIEDYDMCQRIVDIRGRISHEDI